MALGLKLKDPLADLDYTIDWSAWLAEGDTITASAWTVPTGITAASDSFSTTAATIWLTGGTVGAKYTLTNAITTASGREDERSFVILVAAR